MNGGCRRVLIVLGSEVECQLHRRRVFNVDCRSGEEEERRADEVCRMLRERGRMSLVRRDLGRVGVVVGLWCRLIVGESGLATRMPGRPGQVSPSPSCSERRTVLQRAIDRLIKYWRAGSGNIIARGLSPPAFDVEGQKSVWVWQVSS